MLCTCATEVKFLYVAHGQKTPVGICPRKKQPTKPILKLGSFHCWSVRLFVYEAGVLTQPSSFQSCCQLTDLTGIICIGMLDFFQIYFSSPTSQSSAGLPCSVSVRSFGMTRIRNSDLRLIGSSKEPMNPCPERIIDSFTS